MSETYESNRDKRCINKRRLSLIPLQWNKSKSSFTLLILHKLSINPLELKNLDLVFSIKFKPSFVNGLSRYQEELIRVIEELREESRTFKEISEYLKSKGYRSTRDKELSPQLVERMYKKYLKKIEREDQIKTHLDITSIK
jgi:hypothetical protein